MRPDTVIRKSNSWAELFQRLITMKSKEKGDVFERVVQLYLPITVPIGLQTFPVFYADMARLIGLSSFITSSSLTVARVAPQNRMR